MNIVITGASRGLGFSMAETFAAEGHDLFLTAKNEVTLYSALESLNVPLSRPGNQGKTV